MKARRHFLAYFDAGFLSCAALALSAFRQTQRFDRLTLCHPGGLADSGPARLQSELLQHLTRTDRRIRTLPVEQMEAFPEHGDADLRRSHPQLFADLLRAYAFAAAGEPVVVFDLDMLLVADVSDLLAGCAGRDLAAAPDVAALRGDRTGLRLYQGFRAFTAGRPGAVRLRNRHPINCGLLAISSDVSAAFQEGLGHALAYLEAYHAGAAGPVEPVFASLLRHTVGQLAWNYAFDACRSALLPRSDNWCPDHRPTITAAGKVRPAGTRVFHYVGSDKTRMSLDYALLFGGPSPAVPRSQEA